MSRLTPPSYIAIHELEALPLDFDMRGEEISGSMSVAFPKVFARVAHLPDRSKLAMARQLVEWVAWRLANAADVRPLLYQSEALQAAVADFRYYRELEPARAREGIACIVWEAWAKANAVYRKTRTSKGNASAVIKLLGLVRHVLPKPKHRVFTNWVAFSLNRLEAHGQLNDPKEKDPKARLGPWVPAGLFDPSQHPRAEDTPKLMKAFLEGLDPANNPCLLTPDELEAAGFEGTPYTLDLSAC